MQAYDGPIHIADAAQYLKAHNARARHRRPVRAQSGAVRRVGRSARQQNELVNKYWHDVYAQMEDFTSGTTVASGTWPFQVNLLAADGQPIASVVPEEGATGWSDTTMLH